VRYKSTKEGSLSGPRCERKERVPGFLRREQNSLCRRMERVLQPEAVHPAQVRDPG
jgi:hypothetical protein